MASRGQRGPFAARNKYEVLVQALLVKRNIAEVSNATGVPVRTIYRYLADTQFQEMFKESKLKLMDNALLKLRGAADLAVDTLIEICKDQYANQAVRLAAATRILEFGNTADLRDRFDGRLGQLELKTLTAGATIEASSTEPNQDWPGTNNVEWQRTGTDA
jgi:hypothetical protein